MQRSAINHIILQESEELLSQLEIHDECSYIHSLQTTAYYIHFCEYLSLDHCLTEAAVQSVLFHDIGKLKIPSDLLQKTTSLTQHEWSQLQEHPAFSLDILQAHQNILIDPDIVLYHHKNIDQSGYPRSNKHINLGDAVRILRIVDSFEAMTAERPYGHVFSRDEALSELKKYAGKYYDQRFIDAFCSFSKLFSLPQKKRSNDRRFDWYGLS
ncbi:HD-GYP domain-containing protein [Jeotgalibacillus sp. JSM ZJ347]|uniref:HD-GYP domain-containing protein n=1 Tax=Jeotgalibacillus sp. JSM ZJ347 TaxID=3342117 RepID=UPI0035A83E00